MKTFHRILSVLTLVALMLGSALVAAAQDEDREYDPQRDAQATLDYPPANDDQPTQADPPARAARLQYMNGSVSVQPHGTDDWAAGTLNRPLTNSDNIWADKDSRAEISVGTGLIRIDSESSLTLTNITENMVQLQLHQGAMNLHVRRLYDGETYEVDTPNQAFTVIKPGDYRFDVDPNADKTVVTVWRGEGESTGQGPAVRLRANQQARFTSGSQNGDIHQAPSPDGFDEWAQSRDHRLDHSASARYVSPDVVGYEDLDEYGTWRNTSEYGNVWVPSRVDVGWSPYRNGHWIWVDPWGWTWIEDEPWGYAPFHYGRWVYYNNYWGWAPGPIYVRPYYSPALVAWFGGPGWGASFGFGFGYGGGVGWCPLGFGEPFIPWYGVSRGYFNRVNITNTRINITNVTNVYNNTYINNRNNTYINNRGGQGGGHSGDHGRPTGGGPYGPHSGQQLRYANMHAPNGFTAVSRNALVNSQPVARNAVKISPKELNRVSPVHTVDARPTRTTMLGGNAGRSAAMPPQRTLARPVISRNASPANRQGAFHNASPVMSDRGLGRNAGRSAERNPGGNAERNPVQSPGRVNAPMGNPQGGPRPTDSVSHRAMAPGNQTVTPQRGIASHPVPRPPSAGGFEGRGNANANAGGMRPGAEKNSRVNVENNARSNVSRPSAAPVSRPETSRPEMSRPQGRSSAPDMTSRGNVPQPPSAGMSRGQGSSGGGPRSMERPSNSGPSNAGPGNSRGASPAPRGPDRSGPHSEMTVPRPANPVAPRGYSSASDRGSSPGAGNGRYQQAPRPSPSYQSNSRPTPNYGGGQAPGYGNGRNQAPHPSPSYQSNSRQAPSYAGGGSYSRPTPSYDRGSSARSAPSYGGGGYSRPTPSNGGSSYGRSMPSYGGGGGPSVRSMPSYGGGGGGGRAPSSGGGGFGGGRSSGGGGGGGHASAPSSGGGGQHGGRGGR